MTKPVKWQNPCNETFLWNDVHSFNDKNCEMTKSLKLDITVKRHSSWNETLSWNDTIPEMMLWHETRQYCEMTKFLKWDIAVKWLLSSGQHGAAALEQWTSPSLGGCCSTINVLQTRTVHEHPPFLGGCHFVRPNQECPPFLGSYYFVGPHNNIPPFLGSYSFVGPN
jgi:hypothetical protein